MPCRPMMPSSPRYPPATISAPGIEQGGVDRTAPSSLAIWPASGRAAVRPCRGATRPPRVRSSYSEDHCRLPVPPVRKRLRADWHAESDRAPEHLGRADAIGMVAVGMEVEPERLAGRRLEPGGQPERKLGVRRAVARGYVGAVGRRVCGSRDHPRPKASRADRRAFAPTAPDARWSTCAYRVTAARRLAGHRWQACEDRPGNPRPQGDHLRDDRGCGMSIGVRVERRIASSANAQARRIGAPADAQATRKSGFRRSHSHANPRASNVRRAR